MSQDVSPNVHVETSITSIAYGGIGYPKKLMAIRSPPKLLYLRGRTELLDKPAISIVGTREASQSSLDWAFNAAAQSAKQGYVVVSGGAIGVDTAVHNGALSVGGGTICVLGSGLNRIYPKVNTELINRISEVGLVVSECPPDSSGNKITLIERNRITSALGDALLVVATKPKGGAMTQSLIALRQSKRVFAPDPTLGLMPNAGIERLFAKGKITRVRDVRDVFVQLPKAAAQLSIATF